MITRLKLGGYHCLGDSGFHSKICNLYPHFIQPKSFRNIIIIEERFHRNIPILKLFHCRFVPNLYRATRCSLRIFCTRYINHSKITAKCISFLKVTHLHRSFFSKRYRLNENEATTITAFLPHWCISNAVIIVATFLQN